jgi:hypothetical protein
MSEERPAHERMICTRCNSLSGGPFCSKCGFATAPEPPGACAGCGEAISPSTRFCGTCGAAVQGSQAASRSAEDIATSVLGAALVAAAIGVAVTQLFRWVDFEFEPRWWDFNDYAFNPKGSLSAILQIAVLAVGGTTVLKHRRVTLWGLTAIPVSLLGLQVLALGHVLIENIANFGLGGYGEIVQGIAAVTIIGACAFLWREFWGGARASAGLLAAGVIAALFAGLAFFANPLTDQYLDVATGVGSLWLTYDVWTTLISVVLLTAWIGLPIAACLMTDRMSGFHLALGGGVAIVAYYGGWFQQAISLDLEAGLDYSPYLVLNGAAWLVLPAIASYALLIGSLWRVSERVSNNQRRATRWATGALASALVITALLAFLVVQARSNGPSPAGEEVAAASEGGQSGELLGELTIASPDYGPLASGSTCTGAPAGLVLLDAGDSVLISWSGGSATGELRTGRVGPDGCSFEFAFKGAEEATSYVVTVPESGLTTNAETRGSGDQRRLDAVWRSPPTTTTSTSTSTTSTTLQPPPTSRSNTSNSFQQSFNSSAYSACVDSYVASNRAAGGRGSSSEASSICRAIFPP